MVNKSDLKICILNMLLQNKAILFSACSDKITNQAKADKWKEIAIEAKCLGLMPADKEYSVPT